MLGFHVKFVQTETDGHGTKCPRSYDVGAYKCSY